MSPFWRQFADAELLSRLAVLIGVAGLECLVAMWAATSRGHWFWRALAVWVAVMLMVPIRAWEAAWVFGCSSPLIVGVLAMRGVARLRGAERSEAIRSEPCLASQNTATQTRNMATRHNASPNESLTKMYREMDLITVSVLETELAIRLFRLERGRLPGALDELVPGYLSAAPRDPYDQPLHYRVTGDEYTLYSCGWDREDNGGNFGTYYRYLNYHPVYAAATDVKGLQRKRYDFDLRTLTRNNDNGGP